MSDSDNDILELIDQGSYTYAQSLIAKKIKKFPQRSYYYALNNKILHKLGKTSQALQNNVKLMEKYPNDPQAIALLNEFFTEIGMDKEASLVYENVIKRYPNNTSLIIEWFESAIDKFDLRLYNRIFLNLSKSDKSSRLYKFWYAFSYYLLISNSTKAGLIEKELDLFKTLGTRVIEELRPFQNTQELFVYVSLLKAKGNFNGIIQLIENELSFNLDLDLKIIFLEALSESESWQKLFDYSRKLITEEDFNDFNTWKLLLKASKNLGLSFESVKSEIIESQKITRNSLLAVVHLADLYENGALFEAVTTYYQSFNRKLCCFFDLKNYIDKIDNEAFLEMVKESTADILSGTPSTTNDLISLVNNQKFVYLLSKDNIDIKEYISTNWKIYNIFKDNKNIRGGEFDNNPINELTLITIITELSIDDSVSNIIKNIAVIEHLLINDMYNHKLKLWLMKLYANINSTNLIIFNYQKMKIKMIQHETLSHYLYTVNPSKQHLTDFVNIYRFYLTSNEEVRSSVVSGFEKGIFNKLESFINFGSRLADSISRYHIILTIIRFSFVLGDHNYLNYFTNQLRNNANKILSQKEFLDNRDYTSEWKFGLAGEGKYFDQSLLKEPHDPSKTNDSMIKLNILRYLIIFEDREESTNKYMKQFNKIASNYKPQLQFDVLLLKLHLNILKLFKQSSNLNANEQQSILNYLLKNLKFDKIKSILIPSSLLSWQLNHNLINLAEFVKIVNYLSKRTPGNSFIQQLKPCLDQLVKDLKKMNVLDAELKELESLQSKIQITEVDGVKIDETFKLLHDSIEESTVSFLKTL